MATTTRSPRVQLLGIDIQFDFCNPAGALYVPGADKSSIRSAALIRRIARKLSMINLTLDSHQPVHIAHPTSWVDRQGKNPGLFTVITDNDVKTGVWRAADPRKQKWYAHYVAQLAINGRYPLMIWPPHCIIGTTGQALVKEVSDEVVAWALGRQSVVNYVTKGSNEATEHYSALQADVAIDADPSTKINTNLLQVIGEADIIGVLGQASSHCVANTLRDILARFPQEYARKVVLLKDLMDPVPVAAALADKFFVDMAALGVTIVEDSSTWLA